jgi:dipeptidyl aminopeptidase/acylaminoacyl peptidase
MRPVIALAIALGTLLPVPAATQSRRLLTVDDLFNLREVRDPQRSPDGRWVAYTVTRAIRETDKNDTDVWMVSWDGSQHVQLTSTLENESRPRWSPDGRFLSFLSSRQGTKHPQVWLLNRLGGEAVKLTDLKGGVTDYAWSPDSARLVLVVEDPDPADPPDDKEAARNDPPKTPSPIVIDRYYFKADIDGYLRGKRAHLYLFDMATRRAEVLTPGAFDEGSPAWSPDSRRIAFIRRHGEGDVDKAPNRDVFVIEARAGAQPTRLTTTTAEESGRVAWSPDGTAIAYLLGDEPKFSAYDQHRLAVIPAGGGTPRTLTDGLDRPVTGAVWSADSRSLTFVVVDDRSQRLAQVSAAGGTVQEVLSGPRVVAAPSGGSDGNFAVIASTPTEVPEVHAIEAGGIRRLTRQNDPWTAGVWFGTTELFTAQSGDGTEVHGLLVKPASYVAGRRYPTLLRIHGGPNAQDEQSFNFERELFAANGYVVVAANYRGSNGRGSAYQKAIFADWGNKEVVDLLAAVDHVVRIGLADPDRLGIGGWSYGGILTNYVIATDQRFKAAISGAGSSNQIAMYGTDMYIQQYEAELGPPWRAQDLWLKLSYPFFHADRIRTPTLFLAGEKDFNVPLLGSEQMYQALRSLGVDSRLVIYPGQFHGIMTPSYRKDRLERYLEWYAKYLLAPASTTSAGSGQAG